MDDLATVLKRQYGAVYAIEHGGQDYYFRELTEAEYHDCWLGLTSSADAEDAVVTAAVVYPEDFDIEEESPGLVSVLAQQIVEVSGFGDVLSVRQRLDIAREEVQIARSMIKVFILAAMPSYTMEDLEQLTMTQLSEKLAMAEEIIYLTQLMNGFEVSDHMRLVLQTEEEIAAQMEAQARTKRDGGNATLADPIAAKLHSL